MATTYRVRLTGPQLRVLHENHALILNDPDWFERSGAGDREHATFARAAEAVTEAWRKAARAESTPG